jgi:hypothetical protein
MDARVMPSSMTLKLFTELKSYFETEPSNKMAISIADIPLYQSLITLSGVGT